MVTYFIPVGVSSYAHHPQLTAIPDAITSLSAYVREHFPQSVLAADTDPEHGSWSRDRVRKVVEAGLLNRVGNDTVIVYWAGHGEVHGDHRLILTDDVLGATELATWLWDCPAETVICILDCCFSGDAIAGMHGIVERLKKEGARPVKETRKLTVISSARDEKSLEGEFVNVFLDVIRNGPGSIAEDHRWTAQTTKITCAQLVTAINAIAESQQAVTDELRDSHLGAFFPSLWNRYAPVSGPRSVHPDSWARRATERLLRQHGQQPPADWTAMGLRLAAKQIAENGELDGERAMLVERLETLRRALTAEDLSLSLVDKTAITWPVLLAARQAALHRYDTVSVHHQFDLFFEAAQRRAQLNSLRPAEVLVRFIARMAKELGRDPYGDKRVFDWARAEGLDEAAQVNQNIEQACKDARVGRIVINLTACPVAADEFPKQAEAQLFVDGVASDEPIVVPIRSTDKSGVEAEIVELVKLLKPHRNRVKLIDVIVPDLLLLLDPAGTNLSPNPAVPALLGQHVVVSVRPASRFNGWGPSEDFSDDFEDLTSSPFPQEYIDDWSVDLAGLINDTAAPRPVVFRVAPGSRPAKSLEMAAAASPIVLWPATEPADGTHFSSALSEAWPNVPGAVRDARFGTLGANSHAKSQLSSVRMVWDDPDWIELARKYSYG
jgi:hypothetical protein